MRKLALVLATSALFGLAVPAFAVEAGSAPQTRTPVAQADVNTSVKAKASVNARHHRRGVDKTVQHDRGLHRGSKHSRHADSGKIHRNAMNATTKPKVTQ